MIMGKAEIELLTREVWTAMVGPDLTSTLMVEVPEPGLSSQIEIQGIGEVVLRIDCSLTLARQLAANIADLPLDEIDLGLVMDALGEVTNILGGNIKGKWPDAVKQSLPLVWEMDNTEVVSNVWAVVQAFESSAGRLLVRMSKP
jgi:chemotaxis protein CheX